MVRASKALSIIKKRALKIERINKAHTCQAMRWHIKAHVLQPGIKNLILKFKYCHLRTVRITEENVDDMLRTEIGEG